MRSIRTTSGAKRRLSRRGVLTMELVLTLPILMTVILALFQFTTLFYSRSLVVESTRAAARMATQPGVTEDVIEEEVRRILSPRLQEGMEVEVVLGERSGDLVAVGVTVPMSSAAPDLLWPIGLGLDGRNLYHETRMVKE